jgi:hypothetical protein
MESLKKGSKISEKDATDIVRYKYQTITISIPSNSPEEHSKAKKEYEKKQKSKLEKILKVNLNIFEEAFLETYTSSLIKESHLYKFLCEIREVEGDTELYLGGGAVRNLVWDDLHGNSPYTNISDLDIIYFDSLHNTKESDERIEQKLLKKRTNFTWSVKNQARMHKHNNEEAYSSLFEAIQKWPETCTAIAIRLNEKDEIEYVKPYGLTDLYRLIVVPTPHFKHKLERYRERVGSKSWEKTWTNLRIFDLD